MTSSFRSPSRLRSLARLLSLLGLATLSTLAQSAHAQSFGDAFAITSGGNEQRDPVIATDGGGDWLVLWSDISAGTIGASRSSDDGETWSSPATAFTGGDPAVASDGASLWMASYSSAGSIYIATSSDSGATWSTPSAIGTGTGPQIDTNGTGTWVAVWDAGASIEASRSTDGGSNWSTPATLGTGDTPQLATDGHGHWLAVWATSGIDMALSSDDAMSWGSASSVASDPPEFLLHSDERSVDVGFDGLGSWVVVWATDSDLGLGLGSDYDIAVSRSSDLGATWSSPAALHAGAGSDTGHDAAPFIAADEFGNLLVAWTSTNAYRGSDTDLDAVFVASSDGGNSWSLPTAYAETDFEVGGDSIFAHMASGGPTWIAVWYSDESTLTPGDDFDIFGARATGHPAVAGFSIDPARTYLRVGATDTATDAIAIPLTTLGINAPSRLRITAYGDFDQDPGDAESDERTRMIGVFAPWEGLLPNPPALMGEPTLRVPDAIVSDGPTETTDPTAIGALPTDIGQDFAIADKAGTFTEIEVTVPFGARVLYVAAHDDHYADNTDPDGDFAIRITRLDSIPTLGQGGSTLLLLSLALAAAWKLSRRSNHH